MKKFKHRYRAKKILKRIFITFGIIIAVATIYTVGVTLGYDSGHAYGFNEGIEFCLENLK